MIIELNDMEALEFKLFLNFAYAQNDDLIYSVEKVLKQIENSCLMVGGKE